MSLTRRYVLSTYLNQITSNLPVTIKDWEYKELISLCNFFVEIKFCKKIDNNLRQLQEFAIAIDIVSRRKEEMLRTMIAASPGLRDYLIVHSVFPEYSELSNDWLVINMMDILKTTPEELDRIYKKDDVPQEILDKLSMFDPEPIGFEKDPIRIEYGLSKGGFPIRVIDYDWEKITQEKVNVESILATFDHIDVDAKELMPSSFETDEVPF